MKFIFAIFAILAINLPARAEQETITGRWFENDYIFVTNTLWEDVQGSWGDTKYKLTWDSYTKTLKGDTAGVYQELEFDSFQNKIYGESDCGWIQIKVLESKGSVSLNGDFCRNPVDQVFASKDAALVWVKEAIFPEFVREFPEPARPFVLNFLKKQIQPW